MRVETPEWLSRRVGQLKAGVTSNSWLVLVGDSPIFRIEARPAKGRFTYYLTETTNGRTWAGESTFATSEEALRQGLEALRDRLGW
jgi:hypothetical protein